MMTDVEVFRIEAQYYDKNLVEKVVNVYRKRMDLMIDNPEVLFFLDKLTLTK